MGLPDEEDDFDFGARFAELKAEFEAQMSEERQLNKRIAKNLEKSARGANRMNKAGRKKIEAGRLAGSQIRRNLHDYGRWDS